MLAEQGIVSPDDARRDPARARRHRSRAVRRAPFYGQCEDLFFYVDHLLADACRRRGRRPAAHRAQPQRHRHDDVPDAAARVAARRHGGRASSCAGRCSRPRAGTARPSFPRIPTPNPRSRRRSHTICSASSKSSSADSTRLAAAYATTNRNPLGACAITGTGFPIDRRSHEQSAGIRGADRQHLRQHRARSTICSRAPLPRACSSCSWVASRRTCCSGRPPRWAICGCRRVRADEQHHAAEAQSGGTRACARACVAGARRAAGAAARRPQHAVRRHRRHRGRSAAARPRRRSVTRRRGARLLAVARSRRRSSTSTGCARARASAGSP